MSAETESEPFAQPGPQLLEEADLEACLALDQAALGGLWSREQWRKELQEPQRPCLGVFEKQALIALACGWLVVDELHITAVAVSPLHRRKGLGQRVVESLLAAGREQGARHATLEVSSANQAAIALYTSCGFETAGVRRGYYRNGDDALIQWRRLGDMEEVRIAVHS